MKSHPVRKLLPILVMLIFYVFSCVTPPAVSENEPETPGDDTFTSSSGTGDEEADAETETTEEAKRKDEGELFIVKGACTYNRFPGKAEIVSLEFIGNSQVELTFHFIPDNPDAPAAYRFSHVPDSNRKKIFYHGEDTWDAWAKEKGIVPPAEIACIRAEITSGTCTPVVFVFPDIDQ
jgi:hypothetical protein